MAVWPWGPDQTKELTETLLEHIPGMVCPACRRAVTGDDGAIAGTLDGGRGVRPDGREGPTGGRCSACSKVWDHAGREVA